MKTTSMAFVALLLAACPPAEAAGASPGFFALSNAFSGGPKTSPAEQAALLARLGYSGISCGANEVTAEMLAALDGQKLKMHTAYFGGWIDGDKPSVDPTLADKLKLLAPHGSIVWLYLRSAALKPSDPAGDARAVEIVRQVADRAAEAGLRVSLYPHVDFWLERIEDAVRIADKAGRKNVGATFNLCHWLIVDGAVDPRPTLAAAAARLDCVTINGIDTVVTRKNRAGWIQSLDRGDYDLGGLLRALDGVGFRGPVGLQCWSIKEPAAEHLARSAAAWKRRHPPR